MKKYLLILILFLFPLAGPLYGDDADFFTVRVDPNVLIIVDNSGSMNSAIYHSDYNPLATYVGGYTRSTDYYAYYYTYLPVSTTINGRTAGLYYGPGDDGNGVRYSGNYLNWIFWYAIAQERNSLPQQTRMQVARQVLTFLFNNITGVRFGLMKLNYDNGGSLVAQCGSDLTTLNNAINTIPATTWTPLSETMVESWLYFKGDNSFYNSGHYTSPIQYYCQRNFVILVTDGEPTYDYTFPSWVLPGISGHYNTTPQSGNNGYPYYLDGVAWYLNNKDARSQLSGMQNVSTYTIGFNVNSPLLQSTASNGGGQYFTANNADQLKDVLQTVLIDVKDRSFSFTSPTVPAVRTILDNVVYLTFFEPSTKPVWRGDLAAYNLQEDGTLAVDEDQNPDRDYLIWDAADQLSRISSTSRKIYTVISGPGKEEFKTTNSNLTKEVLGVSTDVDRNKLIGHIRGIDTYDLDPKDGNTTSDRVSKLGDMFHSNPVIVGSPSPSFEDEGFNGTNGFYQAKKDRTKVIITGANDGMLHAFNTATGNEEWAFIPNSLLKTLKTMTTTHTYYVDSSPKVADVWFDDNGDNRKTASEWRTVLVCGLRKGGKTYFVLDITDTLNPVYLWEFPKSTDTVTLNKVGQSWSEPAIGRVKVKVGGELYEGWVAFIGGGFDYSSNTGRAFFVVDLKTGQIIKEFSYANGISEMDHAVPAPATAVDTNLDGYIDKVYIGDLGGQMWVFDVSFDPIAKKSNSRWTAQRLFVAPGQNPEKHQIYYEPAVAFDKKGVPWVYFGTGNREDLRESNNPQERFYAVKDDGKGNYPRSENDLSDVTSSNTFNPSSKSGWYIKLQKSANKLEKVLAKPVVFNQLVYFTTYLNPDTTDPCSAVGDANLYVVEYLSGGGALDVDSLSDLSGTPSARSKLIGSEAPSAPVISVNTKGKATVIVGTTTGQVFSKGILSLPSSKNMLYWREVIP